MDTLLWNILQVSLTTSIIILPVFIFCAVLRQRYPARVLCLLWVFFSVRLLVPVQITFPDVPVITPQTTITVATQDRKTNTIQQAVQEEQPIKGQILEISQSQVETPVMVTPKDTDKQPEKKIDFSILLLVIWISGTVILFGIHLSVYCHFWKRIRKTAHEVQDKELLMLYTQEKERLGIQRKIPILQSCEVDSPMMAGILHPRLLLPDTEVAASDIRLILRHELTHYRHGDLYCKLLFMLAKCVHWFNPIIHMLAWQGAQDLEIACDQAVIQGLDTEVRRQYGQCILNHAAGRIGHHQYTFTTQLAGGKRVMKIRLQELFTPPKKRRGVVFLIAVLFAGSIVGCSFAVGAANKPDTETIQQMNTLAQQWCDAQKNQLTPEQAETLLGGNLKEKFDEMVRGYGDVKQDTPLAFDNLPMDAQADAVSYTVNPKDYNATVKIHTNDTPFGGMTQMQTIQFAQEGEVLRIVERTIDEAILLDHPEEICMTAKDVMKRGMPENPVDGNTPMEMVYLNFPVAGGQYYLHALDKNLMIYSFADGTMVYFEFETTADDKYHLKNLIEPQNNAPSQSDAQWLAANQIANQWASGYLHKNAAFSYPVMSKKMQQEFISSQEANYGPVWFWRIGWGSSPRVKSWIVEPESDNSALVVYWLYAGGEEYRYTERLKWITENGRTVIDEYEVVADGLIYDVWNREKFIMLYAASGAIEILPPKIDDTLIQEWKENEPSRYAELLTPEGALQSAIPTFYQSVYEIERVGEKTLVEGGVQLDLKVSFPKPDEPVYITMYRPENQECWEIGRIWSGKPDHTT